VRLSDPNGETTRSGKFAQLQAKGAARSVKVARCVTPVYHHCRSIIPTNLVRIIPSPRPRPSTLFESATLPRPGRLVGLGRPGDWGDETGKKLLLIADGLLLEQLFAAPHPTVS
jgi:hypothetical protein